MSLRLPPIPQALLWAISVLALLVWLGVGWLWWGQKAASLTFAPTSPPVNKQIDSGSHLPVLTATILEKTNNEVTLLVTDNSVETLLVVANEPSLHVFQGLPPDASLAGFDSLGEGQQLQLEITPAGSTSLYVLDSSDEVEQ